VDEGEYTGCFCEAFDLLSLRYEKSEYGGMTLGGTIVWRYGLRSKAYMKLVWVSVIGTGSICIWAVDLIMSMYL